MNEVSAKTTASFGFGDADAAFWCSCFKMQSFLCSPTMLGVREAVRVHVLRRSGSSAMLRWGCCLRWWAGWLFCQPFCLSASLPACPPACLPASPYLHSSCRKSVSPRSASAFVLLRGLPQCVSRTTKHPCCGNDCSVVVACYK